MKPTIYVITHYEQNHQSSDFRRNLPLDDRFLKSDNNYVYYLIDQVLPPVLKGKNVLFEKEIDDLLHKAGARYFAEWAFLLAEAKHSFCHYPFFMISSRFYQKNHWLNADLNCRWDQLFAHFEKYNWGFLPSYDRPLRWIDCTWEKRVKSKYGKYDFFPFTENTFSLIKEVLDIDIPKQYRFCSDLFCNYIGFKNRESFLQYVQHYTPLIEKLFDDQYQPISSLDEYVYPTGLYKNEKPFTFLLELLTHSFFFKTKNKFFAMHYYGFYEIDENKTKMKKLSSFKYPFWLKVWKNLRWQWRKVKTERPFAPILGRIKELLRN